MAGIKKQILKNVFLTIGSMVLLSLFFMMGCFLLSKKIYREGGCEWANIDHIELHMGIDIPALKDTAVCIYDPRSKTKSVYFVLDKRTVPMQHYISHNHFKKLNAAVYFNFQRFNQFNKDTLEKVTTSGNLFFIEGSEKNTNQYKALLDSTTGQLWVALSL